MSCLDIVKGLRFTLAIDLNFNFDLQVEVYMAPSTLKLKMGIGSVEIFESRFQGAYNSRGNELSIRSPHQTLIGCIMAVGRARLALSRFAAPRPSFLLRYNALLSAFSVILAGVFISRDFGNY
jgi:hypothetical protein